jgi:hypothetical protein
MFEPIEENKIYKGTALEMQLRVALSAIRKAADEGKSEVIIPAYKVDKWHMPTLMYEALKPAGFEVHLTKNQATNAKAILVRW